MKMRYVFSLILFVSNAFAQQGTDALIPRTLPEKESGKLIEPETPKKIPPLRDQVFVEALRGLVFIGDVSELSKERLKEEGISFRGLELPNQDEFKKQLSSFLGKPLSLSLLDKINQKTISYLRDRDYLVVDSFVPRGQEIGTGIVQIAILKGELGAVKVRGAKFSNEARLKEKVRAEVNKPIQRAELEEDIEWLNQNPFRSVQILLEKGENFGETNLLLDVKDRRPWRVYLGAENSGTELTGEDRFLTGINWGDAFGLDHQFGYQFTKSLESGRTDAHGLSYVIPLNWRHILSISAAYVSSNPPADNNGFDLDGEAWQIGLDYKIPLRSTKGLSHNLQFGLDFKRSNNDLLFGSETVFQSFTNIYQLNTGYNGRIKLGPGSLGFNLKLTYSPGGIDDDNSDEAFNSSRAQAKASYFYSRLGIEWDMPIYKKYSWNLQVDVQEANANLLGSEQTGIGGYASVRGYDEYEAVGDKGLIVRNELRTPRYSLFSSSKGFIQAIQFLDFGHVENVDQLAGEKNNDLSSAGLGLRYGYSTYLSTRFDFGWQLRAARGKEKAERLHWSLVFSY